MFHNAPVLHKVMWVVWGIAAMAVAVYALFTFDPDFLK
jgi:hypothetical protein